MDNEANKEKHGLAVDIDETLSWTVGFYAEHLRNHFGNPENLSAKEIVDKYRFTRHVPYWQHEEAKAWVQQAKRDHEIQENLPLIEDSNHTLNAISRLVPIVLYLTMRPPSVELATKRWLQKHGFPEAPLMFPDPNADHANTIAWKAQVLEDLYPRIFGIIEDNPEVIMALSKDYQGTVYLYNNSKSPRNDIRIIPCETWPEVLVSIKKDFEKRP